MSQISKSTFKLPVSTRYPNWMNESIYFQWGCQLEESDIVLIKSIRIVPAIRLEYLDLTDLFRSVAKLETVLSSHDANLVRNSRGVQGWRLIATISTVQTMGGGNDGVRI